MRLAGFLGTGASRTAWTWSGRAPLGHSFQIREPVVPWFTTAPIQSDWSAAGNLAVGLFGVLAGVLLTFLCVLRAVGAGGGST